MGEWVAIVSPFIREKFKFLQNSHLEKTWKGEEEGGRESASLGGRSWARNRALGCVRPDRLSPAQPHVHWCWRCYLDTLLWKRAPGEGIRWDSATAVPLLGTRWPTDCVLSLSEELRRITQKSAFFSALGWQSLVFSMLPLTSGSSLNTDSYSVGLKVAFIMKENVHLFELFQWFSPQKTEYSRVRQSITVFQATF